MRPGSDRKLNGEKTAMVAAPQSTGGNGRAVPPGDRKSGDILGTEGLLRNAPPIAAAAEAEDRG